MKEIHKIKSIGWLRAAVLGANDGIVSTASLVIGVAAAQATHESVVVAAIAGLVSGAMSMATGEYVSVSSQADTESAALSQERAELPTTSRANAGSSPPSTFAEVSICPSPRRVADKLMSHDALGAHARDELGISDITTARPLQAAGASALSFAVGAALPLVVVAFYPGPNLAAAVAVAALVALAALGALAAKTGGARLIPGVVRVTFWSALAMAVTYGVGTLFGTVAV